MLSKLAMLVAGFVLLTATTALAEPLETYEERDAATSTLNAPSVYFSGNVQLPEFVSDNEKDSGVTGH